MFDFTAGATRLHVFAHENAEAIQTAAVLLGGQRWLHRVQSLLDDLANSPALTRRIKAEAREFYELLSLEHVCDFERPEAWYFAGLDPAMPHTAEICLLTEKLAEALADLDRATAGARHQDEERRV